MKTLTRKRAWPGRLKETSEALARAGCYGRFVIANRIGGDMSRIIRPSVLTTDVAFLWKFSCRESGAVPEGIRDYWLEPKHGGLPSARACSEAGTDAVSDCLF